MLRSVFFPALFAVVLGVSGVRLARVDGSSMAPTLGDQDLLVVDTLAYRADQPGIGDIVMFRYPRAPKKLYVKRIIAREGDAVRITTGSVYVNGRRVADDYVPPEFRGADDWGPEIVPSGFVFVMGDHRNRSSDSRHWGAVAKHQILGKITFRWWPLYGLRTF